MTLKVSVQSFIILYDSSYGISIAAIYQVKGVTVWPFDRETYLSRLWLDHSSQQHKESDSALAEGACTLVCKALQSLGNQLSGMAGNLY